MKNLAHIGEALFTFGKLSGLMNLMGNSEGSLVIPQIYKARRNLILRTSAEQLSIILGSVLGDAYIYPQGKSASSNRLIKKNTYCGNTIS